MATNDIVQTIAEARIDARSLSEFVYKPANFMVSRRLSPPINTLEFFLNYFNSINSTYQASAKTVQNAVNQAQQAVIAADALIATNANNASNAVASAIEGVAVGANIVTDALMTIVPIDDSGINVRTQRAKNRENINVLDFFTAQELEDYRTLPHVDLHRPIQAFFDYISANDVGTAYCSGTYKIGSPILIGGALGTKTKMIVGNLELIYLRDAPAIDTLVTLQTGENVSWSGKLHVQGADWIALNYDRRKVKTGIMLGGQYKNVHFSIDTLQAENGFKGFGVYMGNLTTGCNIGKIRGNRSGSGYETGGYTSSLLGTFTLKDTIAGSGTQRSVLTVDAMPFFLSEASSTTSGLPAAFAYINEELYIVMGHVNSTKEVSIFPLLPEGVSSGSLKWVYGGVFYIAGGDASVVNIGNISATTSAICCHLAALYPPTIANLTCQDDFIGVVIGASLSAGFEGGTLGEMYCEQLKFNYVQLTKYPGAQFAITNNVGFTLEKCVHMSNFRTSNQRVPTYKPNLVINYKGSMLQPQIQTSGSTLNLDMASPEHTAVVTGTAAKTINVSMSSSLLLDMFNICHKRVMFQNDVSGSFTNSVTFVPQAGTTINGSSDNLVFTGLSGVPVFDLVASIKGTVTIARAGYSAPALSAQKTYDAPSLAAATTQTTTITLTGAKIGDAVAVSLDKPLLGTRLWGEVTSANVVTVYHRNDTGETVDVASGTLTVKII